MKRTPSPELVRDCQSGRAYDKIRPPGNEAYVGEWCNGSTAVFGTVNPGSNPGSPALRKSVMNSVNDEDPPLGYKPNNNYDYECRDCSLSMRCLLSLKQGVIKSENYANRKKVLFTISLPNWSVYENNICYPRCW